MSERPAPFEAGTPRELWTDPHISEQMLRTHTDASLDLASHRHTYIERACDWIIDRFALDASRRVVDFGCGPGLWCRRLAQSGAAITGLDFSARSLAYAREDAERAKLSISYVECDYIEWQSAQRFDLILMAMYDYCVLGPNVRHALLRKWASLLSPEGRVFFDVQSLATFHQREEFSRSEPQLMGGFWAAGEYQGSHEVVLYPDQSVALDRFKIVESERTREFSNWMQYFDQAALQRELEAAGLRAVAYYGDLAGSDFDADATQFAVEACLA